MTMTGTVSAATRDQIIKWHEDGYSVDETARLLKLSEETIIGVLDNAHARTREQPPIAEDVPLFQ